MKYPSIAVYGANGHTGKFVVNELRSRGCNPILISRHKIESVEGIDSDQWRQAACDNPDDLDNALEGAAAVINCAGPFLDTAASLVEAALRQSIHYLDISAEQRSALQTYETYKQQAKATGVAVLPAMAFYGGLADLLATELTQGMQSVDSVTVAIALDSWYPTSGTRKTGERNTARRLVVEQGVLTPLAKPAPAAAWKFPAPFGEQRVVSVPLSEIITISRHIAARRITSFMNETPLVHLRDSTTPAPSAADSSGRSAQQFVVDVIASGAKESKRLTASGQDIYAITAPLVVEACLRILDNADLKGGTYTAGELFDPTDFLLSLGSYLKISRADNSGAYQSR